MAEKSCAFCEAEALLKIADLSDGHVSSNADGHAQGRSQLDVVEVNTHCDYQGHCLHVNNLPSRDGIFVHIPCQTDADGEHSSDCTVCRLTRSFSF
eukprot:gnl/MRDRNA2_/MRDRNA2_177218_c0_seq1.p1 gnl/MRDRNA2_/MRDRNA2_177218_c0~~gnl/MRDRNA2_/MRDRNA2_177218_c0_seq1.p1  ORF type:complete len:106 (+),score=12.07 gnl/MRDRNA2_/MRDRNA2_177218_c0_seq1:33-320(+)